MSTAKPTVRVQIAEAMGWRYWHDQAETLLLSPNSVWPAHGHWVKQGMKPGDGRPASPLVDTSGLPAYDTDANAALTLISTLEAEGWIPEIASYSKSVWQCAFIRYTEGEDDIAKHEATAPTFQLAICAAFLRVKGAK